MIAVGKVLAESHPRYIRNRWMSAGSRRGRGRSSSWLHRLTRTTFIAAVASVIALPPQSASAWCWRPRIYSYGYGCGWRPFCGPRIVTSYGCSSYTYSYSYSAYGCGWPAYGACGPRFYSGCAYPAVIYGWYPGGISVGWGFNGFGCSPFGWYGWGPFAATTPGASPIGVDFSTLASARSNHRPMVNRSFASVPMHAPPEQLARAPQPSRTMRPTVESGRLPPRPAASSTAARMKAGKLVAAGDTHVRAGLDTPDRLKEALRSYDQAARVAADLPDTHLRRAIVLTAMGRTDEARSAVSRAAAIDARLSDSGHTRTAETTRQDRAPHLPPDPVFGERDGGPTTLDSRTASLIARMFRGEFGGTSQPADNWIAASWEARNDATAPQAPGQNPSTRLAVR